MAKSPSPDFRAHVNAKFDELDAHRRFSLRDLSEDALNALGGLARATHVGETMRESIQRSLGAIATLHAHSAMELAVAKGRLPLGMYIDRCELSREGVVLL